MTREREQRERESARRDRVGEARRLHAEGYTARAVHARWVLDAFRDLYGHLTDQGEPLTDGGEFDPSHYLTVAEWREVEAAARTIVDLAPIIAVGLESDA